MGSWLDSDQPEARQPSCQFKSIRCVLYFDISDSTGWLQSQVLPFVSRYYKSQLLRDRKWYFRPMYGNRIFADYYNKEFGIVDDNPVKQHKVTAGYHIPVYPSVELYNRSPQRTVILAWIHTIKIIASHGRYVADGGEFLMLHPEVTLVNKDNYDEVLQLWK